MRPINPVLPRSSSERICGHSRDDAHFLFVAIVSLDERTRGARVSVQPKVVLLPRSPSGRICGHAPSEARQDLAEIVSLEERIA